MIAPSVTPALSFRVGVPLRSSKVGVEFDIRTAQQQWHTLQVPKEPAESRSTEHSFLPGLGYHNLEIRPMNRSVSVFVIAILATLAQVHAETERSASVSLEMLRGHINYLASDELGGRGVGSKGIDLAAEYIASQFLKYGILPGGDDGSYFQWFDVVQRRRDPDSPRIKTKNVIGILPGAGPLAHEYVVFGGHYDHIGNVPPRRRPRLDNDFDPADARIHNGADDNASGTAGVLELARIYASGPKPRRSLIFMGFSGEELGLLGSAHFAKHPTVPLEDIVAMINMDMIGRLEGRAVEVWAVGTGKEFDAFIDKHVADTTNLQVKKEAGMRFDSDHASFYAKDIPVIFVFSGLHEDYHRPSDDVDKIDYDGAIGIVQFIQAVADDIIQADERPTFQEVKNTSPRGGRRLDLKVRMGFRPGAPDSDEPSGILVESVVEGGPADQAGIKAGDIIIAINKTPVKNFMDYVKAVKPFKPGDQTDVTVRRGDREVSLKVTFTGRRDR